MTNSNIQKKFSPCFFVSFGARGCHPEQCHAEHVEALSKDYHGDTEFIEDHRVKFMFAAIMSRCVVGVSEFAPLGV